VQVAQSKKEKRDKEAAEAAAKKAADDWTAKVAADKALSDRRKTAAAAGPEALAAFEAELAAEAERKKWTADDEKAYWAEIKRINDERKAEAAAEAKRRKVGVVGATLLSPLPSPRRPASPPPPPCPRHSYICSAPGSRTTSVLLQMLASRLGRGSTSELRGD
jgi:hypothetical protein